MVGAGAAVVDRDVGGTELVFQIQGVNLGSTRKRVGHLAVVLGLNYWTGTKARGYVTQTHGYIEIVRPPAILEEPASRLDIQRRSGRGTSCKLSVQNLRTRVAVPNADRAGAVLLDIEVGDDDTIACAAAGDH